MGKLLKDLASETADLSSVNVGDAPARLQPKTAVGQVAALAKQRDEADDRAEAAERQVAKLQAELDEAKRTGTALEVALDQLREVPGRRRKLTDQQYNELKANLTHNRLGHPITVRPHPDGGYEIISGHNRVAIFRELGRKTIPAWPMEFNDSEAEDTAFFTNALQEKLSDYQLFKGYTRYLAKHPDLSNVEVAERGGISEMHLRRILAFGDLPTPAHDILELKQHLIGASTAYALAAQVSKDRGQQVVEALQKLASGEFKREGDAEKYAATAGIAKQVQSAPVSEFRLGKSKYATVRRLNKMVRIDCASEEEAAVINRAVEEAIAKRIEALKGAK